MLYLAVTDDPVARRHASAALNWQLSLLLYLIGAVLVLALAGSTLPPIFFLIVLLVPALVVLDLVLCTLGAVKSGNGEDFT